MERIKLLAELKQLRGFSDDVEENGEHMFMMVMIHMIRWMKLGWSKMWLTQSNRKGHDNTLNVGVDMSHDFEAVSHDSYEDGSHDLAAGQTSPSSDVTAIQMKLT